MSNIVTLYVEDDMLRFYEIYGYEEDDKSDLIIEVEDGLESDEYEYTLSEEIDDVAESFKGDYLRIKQEDLQEEGLMLTIKKIGLHNTAIIPIEGRLVYRPIEPVEVPPSIWQPEKQKEYQ